MSEIQNSSLLEAVVDIFKVRTIASAILLFCILFPGYAWADPFEKYNEELNQLMGAGKASVFASQDKSINQLFKTGKFAPAEESIVLSSMEDLPKYLKFSTIVSSKIINEKGEVVKRHTIKSKDTLSSISRHYGTTIQKIKDKNGLKTDLIRLGDVLEIPVVTSAASRKKVVTKRIFIKPVPESRISSRFGRRKDPFNKYSRNFHSGLDMAAGVGTPVVASADGEVVFTGKNGGYGNTVILLHSDGYKTVYAHCSKIVVEVGEKVKMGRVIAAVGRTGTATGAHLHFEVFRNGKLINPETALNSFKKTVTKLSNTEVAGL